MDASSARTSEAGVVRGASGSAKSFSAKSTASVLISRKAISCAGPTMVAGRDASPRKARVRGNRSTASPQTLAAQAGGTNLLNVPRWRCTSRRVSLRQAV